MKMMERKNLCKLAAIAALGLSISGCGANSNKGIERSLYSVHQPVVQNQTMVFDIASYGGSIGSSEAARLDSWFNSVGLRYGDHLTVYDPAGSNMTLEAVERVTTKRGLVVERAIAGSVQGMRPGMIRVVINRATASVPGCPDWSRNSSTNLGNATSSNYGCATNSNMAAMIADPNDLVRGRKAEPGSYSNDTLVATKAIQAYTDAEPTGKSGLQAPQPTTSAGGGGN